MRLPFGKGSIRRSKHNGLIVTNEQGEVLAFGTRQTSVRYPKMWGDALARTAPFITKEIKRVLLLGLAGGGALAPIHAAYPGADVTAVEYDPAMVEIARDLLAGAPYPFPRIIVADAQQALASMDESFDLTLVDIFVGARPAPATDTKAFWDAVKARLADGGAAIYNVAGDSTRVYEAQKHFARSVVWQYNANTFCALA